MCAERARDGVVELVGGTVQLLCLKVRTQRSSSCLAAGYFGLVSSRLVAALCMQLLCLKAALTVTLLGGRVFWFGVELTCWQQSGTVHAVAVFKSDCEVLGL